MTDALLKPREAAAILGVSTGYLRQSSCPKTILPSNGAGGKPVIRYRRSDLLAWIDAHTFRSRASFKVTADALLRVRPVQGAFLTHKAG